MKKLNKLDDQESEEVKTIVIQLKVITKVIKQSLKKMLDTI